MLLDKLVEAAHGYMAGNLSEPAFMEAMVNAIQHCTSRDELADLAVVLCRVESD